MYVQSVVNYYRIILIFFVLCAVLNYLYIKQRQVILAALLVTVAAAWTVPIRLKDKKMKWYWNRARTRGHLWDGITFNSNGNPVAMCYKLTPLYPMAPRNMETGFKKIPEGKKCRFCLKGQYSANGE